MSPAARALGFGVRAPEALGGSGEGLDPEQLFAAGLAACNQSALHAAARQRKIALTDSTVGDRVELATVEDTGIKPAVHPAVSIPSQPHETALAVAHQAVRPGVLRRHPRRHRRSNRDRPGHDAGPHHAEDGRRAGDPGLEQDMPIKPDVGEDTYRDSPSLVVQLRVNATTVDASGGLPTP
ncbi:MAG: OsmC family protein [Janthinobacterium lividum]